MAAIASDSIRDAIGSYAIAVDAMDRELLGECFAADAAYVVQVADEVLVECHGREEIVELNHAVASGQQVDRRHLVSNVVVKGHQAVSYLTVLELGEAVTALAVARVDDEFVADDGLARIARRVINLDRPL